MGYSYDSEKTWDTGKRWIATQIGLPPETLFRAGEGNDGEIESAPNDKQASAVTFNNKLLRDGLTRAATKIFNGIITNVSSLPAAGTWRHH